MSVFGGSRLYGQQGAAPTPDFTGAARTSALVQAQNQQRRDQIKQQNLSGGFKLANALREGGTEGGGSVVGDMGGAIADGWKGGAAPGTSAGAGALSNAALTGGPAASQYAVGATIPGAGMVAGGGGLGAAAGSAGSVASATAPAAGAAIGGGLGGAASGAAGALASNPVGWAALAALAAYSLFG